MSKNSLTYEELAQYVEEQRERLQVNIDYWKGQKCPNIANQIERDAVQICTAYSELLEWAEAKCL